MTQDKIFRCQEPYAGWAARTARDAVLFPLFGRCNTPAEITAKTLACLAEWRERATALHAAGGHRNPPARLGVAGSEL